MPYGIVLNPQLSPRLIDHIRVKTHETVAHNNFLFPVAVCQKKIQFKNLRQIVQVFLDDIHIIKIDQCVISDIFFNSPVIRYLCIAHNGFSRIYLDF